MDPAFKVLGAVGLSVSAGAMLGMTTPTAMKEAAEPAWRIAAREANAGQAAALPRQDVVYSVMPEDLSPQIGYGSPEAYRVNFAENPQRGRYEAVPDYRPAALPAEPAAPSLAERRVPIQTAARNEPTIAMVLPVDPPQPEAAPRGSEQDPAMDDVTPD